MAADLERLIESLAAEAKPVRRLRPPALRAGLLLLAVTAAAALGIMVFADFGVFFGRMADSALVIEFSATAITGMTAVLAAFYLSLPDRSSAWALLPLPSLGVWIASSSYSCYRHLIVSGPGGWELGESAHCLMFILALGLPLMVVLLVVLRRALPLTPIRVGALGALGAAGLTATALQFFHPFDVTFLDLGVHLGAVGLVVGVAASIEYVRPYFRPALAR